MARPAKGSSPGAVERLAEAFWGMLSEMPYSEIKVVSLARRAGASPNTLYYHFGCVADLARYALEAELDARLVSDLLAGAPPSNPAFCNRNPSSMVPIPPDTASTSP